MVGRGSRRYSVFFFFFFFLFRSCRAPGLSETPSTFPFPVSNSTLLSLTPFRLLPSALRPPPSPLHLSTLPPYGAGLSLTIVFTFRSYAARSFLNRLNASACAGDSGFGSFSRSWIPSRICLIVMAGFQPSSSLRIERQTVPEG